MKKISIIIPAYNEEEALPALMERITKFADDTKDYDFEFLFVNDGSKDKTWGKIQEKHNENPMFSGINLSRNRGHQNALLAGLMTVRNLADCVISMDADLQDDINAIDEMLEKFENENCDIVYGVRDNRDTDTVFKRRTAGAFYKLMQGLGSQSVPNHADFRLMSRRALDGLAQFPEQNLFLRGMVPLVGYKSDIVYYKRGERFAGESKYPLKKMISFALDGITSTSAAPMRLIFWIGLVWFLLAIVGAIYIIVRHFINGSDVAGWASTMLAIVGFGGANLLALGVIGEYIGKIFLEVKQRPRYLIEDFINEE